MLIHYKSNKRNKIINLKKRIKKHLMMTKIQMIKLNPFKSYNSISRTKKTSRQAKTMAQTYLQAFCSAIPKTITTLSLIQNNKIL